MAENKETNPRKLKGAPPREGLTGAGPKILAATLLFSIPAAFINHAYFSRFKLVVISNAFTFYLSLALVLAGAALLLWSGAVLLKWSARGELAVTGPFSVVRNPIYSAWIFFIVPGIIVNLQYPFLFIIPIFMHRVSRYFISLEEKELEERFGDEYARYMDSVPGLFPNPLLYKRWKAEPAPEEQKERVHKRAVAGLFDRAAPAYDRIGPRFFAYFGRRLAEIAGVSEGAAVLDAAAGRGASLIPAAEAAGKNGYVIGIDISPAMVRETARQLEIRSLKNAEVQRMDAEKLAFPDGSFDIVLGGFCVFFFHDPEKALGGFNRVLRPGGKLALSTWGEYEDRDWARETAKKYCESNPLAEMTARRFDTPDALAGILERAGFFNIAVREETKDFLYGTPEEWWQTQYSHGIRGILERVEMTCGAEGLEAFKREAFAFFESRRGPDGFRQSMKALFASATK